MSGVSGLNCCFAAALISRRWNFGESGRDVLGSLAFGDQVRRFGFGNSQDVARLQGAVLRGENRAGDFDLNHWFPFAAQGEPRAEACGI